MELSKRLEKILEMVTPGLTVADIGCDHGFVSIELVRRKDAPRVFACDVRTGPLQRATEHVRVAGLEEKIVTRLADGLTGIEPGDAESCVIAGMGGHLMADILNHGMDRVLAMRELILQPQSDLEFFRAFLRENNLIVGEEDMIFEDGKYYPLMKVYPLGVNGKAADDLAVVMNKLTPFLTARTTRLCDTYGPYLLGAAHPVLRSFLEREKRRLREIEDKLSAEGGKEERSNQIALQLEDIELCLSLFDKEET